MKAAKELIEDAEAVLDDIEELQGKAAEVETDEELEKVQEKIDAKEKQYEKLEKRIESAKALQERRQKAKELRDGLQAEEEGDVAPEADGKGEDAKGGDVKVTQSEEREHTKLFLDYMGGKELSQYSSKERDFLHPDSDVWDDGATGVRLPKGFKRVMFGARFGKCMDLYGGKAIQSDDVTDAYLVDEDYLAQLLELEPEPGHLLGRVTVVPVKGGAVEIPRLQQTDSNEYGGMAFTWKDEGEAKAETEPTFEQVKITCHEVNGYTEISETMLRRNAVAANNIVTRLYREGMRDELDSVVIAGTGVGQPQGIINAAGIRTVARETAGTVGATDVVGLKHAVLPHHRANAAFIIHDDVEEQTELDDIDREHPLIRDGQLKNMPYEVTVRQPAMGNDGDAIFGDPTGYYLAMEQDIVVKRSEHYQFRNNLVSFAVFAVVGGQLALPRSMAILEEPSS